jgi:hypothetical protein
MVRRDVQRTALPIVPISDVEVWSVQALGIAATDTIGIATAAGGLREAALNHGFGGLKEALNEPLLLKHSLILRYAYLI